MFKEMFYASYLANKKNPLRLIWIAAHWEKKVSKNQVFQTDIKTIVNEICRNKVSRVICPLTNVISSQFMSYCVTQR